MISFRGLQLPELYSLISTMMLKMVVTWCKFLGVELVEFWPLSYGSGMLQGNSKMAVQYMKNGVSNS